MAQKNVKIAFYGAGTIGKRMLKLWQCLGLEPDYVIDTNVKGYWGSCPIKKLSELDLQESIVFLITCKKYQEIADVLIGKGVKESVIFDGSDYCRMLEFLLWYQENNLLNVPVNLQEVSENSREILIDLQNGNTLGGVENWAYQMQTVWKQLGYMPSIIYFADKNGSFNAYDFQKEEVIVLDGTSNDIYLLLEVLFSGKYGEIICNFPYQNFQAACFAKFFLKDKLRVVAVCHNDEQIYYDVYGAMHIFIDRLLVISQRMMEKFLEMGVPAEKMQMLSWKVECQDALLREWNLTSGLCIGYAGRITKNQKRIDLLMEVIEGLEGHKLDYCFSFAGNGENWDELQEFVESHHLQHKVRLLGFIPPKQIKQFWTNNDIMVSCSDWEGHSLTQCEAMAAGAVPIVTDVSGVRDDIMDGYNGFVVPIGEPQMIIDRILELYRERSLLREMGTRAHQHIVERNRQVDVMDMWDKILKG